MEVKKFSKYEFNNLKPDKILDFPTLRQMYNYDCGACALQQVFVYYGVEKREQELLQLLDTKNCDIQENGTKFTKMKEVSEYYGLKCDILKKTDIKTVKKLIDEEIPVILLIQAWRDFSDKNLDWKKDYSDGHYVVAVGYNDNCIFFEDPSSFTRTYLTYKELDDRWHGYGDDNKSKADHYAVVVYGKKQYDSEKIIHMD